ncbi:hypothetical protein A11A3_07825 [Alcanivorax hongdengensis A-11-3]|uniref:DNA-binding protein n=1 Tax=Alcanivorax hongdengensis A-11-3 TaxID=1177179 RepID=L0WCQ0_9GAMM|nr:hypothetical protein [Alcanivorax hongdengensis]EKF74518.1 hypothetical protein A11A3_07825 [Alcanivorax hongdengensis A-11-3]
MLKRCLLASALFTSVGLAHAAPYQWNYPAPLKTPGTNDNGKVVLFDVSHGGTEGNADWVIDGGFSDFADDLVSAGYTVQEYRGVDKNSDGIITFVDDYHSPTTANSNANEAVITYAGISHADVLVLAESNRPFTQAEQQALEDFLADGKGIYFIADHYNADRNLNSWDATEVYNGYNRSTASQFNIGGDYGDLRNPAMASGGWLAQQFGLRFRFNAIDWLSGVSGIVSASQGEGITSGVGPVLMAGGATLAITDPSRAKGLVYFSGSDSPARWSHAVDSGLYFGGQNEGPYVAIAKSGAGKAAFIGDSSPIEDASPKYKRQDNGQTKSTYPGWTDSGNAAQLSLNLVDWLATPESYTHFNSSAHPAGIATPTPLASEESDDPDNGQPWSSPSSGYNPWDASTFDYGAYGAADGPGNSGNGGSGNALSVSDALALPTGSNVTVVGTITQAINGEYALEIQDSQGSATLYVKLESQYRNDFSPQNNPAVIGQTLEVIGQRDNYMGEPSVESVSAMQLVSGANNGGSGSNCSSNAVSVSDAYASSQGTPLTVIGQVIGGINDPYALELQDLNNSTSVYVKLESDQRAEYSPANNPAMVGQTLEVDGVRDLYMNTPSVESVSALTVISDCP